jgi:hypothetical protein
MIAAARTMGEEICGEIVVARGDATEVLDEVGEHAFDQVALAIGASIVGDRRLAAGAGFQRDVPPGRLQSIGVVDLVGDQPLNRAGGG